MNILKSAIAWFAGLFSKESSMNLTASQVALAVGATTQLNVSEPSTFSLSTSGVLSIDATGLATAIAVGSVTVTATSIADATQTATLDFAVVAAAVVEPAPVPATIEAQAPDVIEKLEDILAALGHKLPVFWGEAVALAKKAI